MAQPKQQEELERLIQAIAEALDLPPERVVEAFERNEAQIHFGHDETGRRTIGVRIADRAARFAADLMAPPGNDPEPAEPA